MANSLTNLQFASDSDVWVVLEVPKLAPDVDASNNASGTKSTGTNSEVTVVRSPDGQMVPPPGYAVDMYDWYVDYPIDADGTRPDVELRFQVAEEDVPHTLTTEGYHRIMHPRFDRLVAGKDRVPYSESMRSIYNLLKKKGKGKVKNIPLRILGIKVPSQKLLKAIFRSSTGWGQSGSALRPMRLYMKADMWTADELAQFGAAYDGQFSITRVSGGTVNGQHQIPARLDDTNVDQLPNGTNQVGQSQIYRKITWATNNEAIATKAPFIYSVLQAVGGQQNNIDDTRHDLGFAYKGTRKAFIPYELGVDFNPSILYQGNNPQVYVGWYRARGRLTLPNMYANGLLISSQRNPFQWGGASPQSAQAGSILPLAPAADLISFLLQGENMVPVASTAGLSQINAKDLDWAVGGIEVVQ